METGPSLSPLPFGCDTNLRVGAGSGRLLGWRFRRSRLDEQQVGGEQGQRYGNGPIGDIQKVDYDSW